MEFIPEKLLLCYKTSLKGGMVDNLNDETIIEPINQLINKKNEIDIIVNSKKNNLFKFLYFNWKIIDDILYEEDYVIDLNNKKNILKQLSDFFYLDLIIKNNEEIKEFNYTIKLIDVINNIQINNKDEEIFKKLICDKIIIDLINNIYNNDNVDADTDILDNIKKSNENIIENIIKNNLIKTKYNFESIDNNFLNDINEKKIDEIYSFILEEIIKNKIFDKIESILEELDIKNIDLTNTILIKLKEIFQNEVYLNNYKISDLEDLINDNEKINFYNALQKYIFKNSLYIYQIDFFIDFRKIIISSLKSKPEEILRSINDHKSNKDKIISIINFYTGSDYFYGKYIEEFEIFEFYKQFKSDYIDIGDFKYKCNATLKRINANKLVNFKLKKNFIKFKEGIDELKQIFEMNRSFLKNISIKYRTQFNENKLLLFLALSKHNNTIIKSFCFENILKKGLNKTQGFLYLMKYINKESSNQKISLELKRDDSINSSSSSSLSMTNNKQFFVCKFYKYKRIYKLLNDKNKYEILNIERLISHHQSSVETISEINDYYISIDLNNNIYLYDNNFIKVDCDFPPEEKVAGNLILNNQDIILPFNNGVYLYKFNDAHPKIDKIIKLTSEPASFFIKLDKNMILANKKYIKILKSFSQEEGSKKIGIITGIKIGINSAAFLSNSNLVNGHDEIYFYDNLRNDIVKFDIKENYFFVPSRHSLNLMPNERGWKVFLLCGCKNTNEKNGILIINLISLKERFQSINNFEVHCFCPIFIIKQKNDKLNNYYTNYFFVGGFDTIKKRGGIKLYKLNYEDDNIKKIEFIQDITFEKQKIKKFGKDKKNENSSGKEIEFEDYIFKGFESSISCITQSTKTGKILITCWDGNVFLLSEPNISIYLKDDEEKRNLRYTNI